MSTEQAFPCPYCWGQVHPQASVCTHCTRDLVLFKPLAQRVQQLSAEVDGLRESLARQQASLERLQAAPALAAPGQPPLQLPPPSAVAAVQAPPRSWAVLLGVGLATLLALALCHWVLLFLYDAPPLYLRLVTLVLPMLTGFWASRQGGVGAAGHVLVALLVGLGAVVAMLWITARIDGVPLWPTSTRDWQETVEYAAAICLGFLTGHLADRLLRRIAALRKNRLDLRVLLERDEDGQFRIANISNQVQNLVSALAPLASAGTALYTGLKAFTGE